MKLSQRTEGQGSNILMELEQARLRLVQQGKTVINLSAGTPDLPPDEHVMRCLAEASLNPENYKYALRDFPVLTDAVIAWYSRRYGVNLHEGQICAVNGSQEGLAHIGFALCDVGDTVLTPDPGYPIFHDGPRLAGAQLYPLPLLAENNFLIDFDTIPAEVARQAKFMIVCYPNNPLTVLANDDFYERLIHFAQKHDIIVLHDNAYSELVLNGQPGGSFLRFPGAMEVGIEFNSLSKSYNLTGMRVSFAVGNEQIIQRFKSLRSRIDYGIFPAVQYAAAAALTGSQNILERNRASYRERRDALCQGLRTAGWPVQDSVATMFCWFQLPAGRMDSSAFAFELLEKTGVICVPGISFGQQGEGYVRMALVQPPETLRQAAQLIGASGVL